MRIFSISSHSCSRSSIRPRTTAKASRHFVRSVSRNSSGDSSAAQIALRVDGASQMMFRKTGDTVIAIPQPSHAWLSGQAIRAWGNEEFGYVAPFEDVCLGAEQHDIGWLSWERSPTLNTQTGRPHGFRELDVAQHTELWRQGSAMAMVLGRYPALLVSLHGSNLYRNFDFTKAGAAVSAVGTKFLQDQAELQQELCDSLAGDHAYAQYVSPAALQRNRLLVSAVDRLSIAV